MQSAPVPRAWDTMDLKQRHVQNLNNMPQRRATMGVPLAAPRNVPGAPPPYSERAPPNYSSQVNHSLKVNGDFPDFLWKSTLQQNLNLPHPPQIEVTRCPNNCSIITFQDPTIFARVIGLRNIRMQHNGMIQLVKFSQMC